MDLAFWNARSSPTFEQEKHLRTNFEQHCKQAATAIEQAHVLLLVTGAGFSADSGLAVYADVASIQAYRDRGLDYCDICQPYWLEKDPELFYGFWGQCFNDYRQNKPHVGYDIVARWRDEVNDRRNNDGAIAKEIRQRIQRKMHVADSEDDGERLNEGCPYLVTDGPAGAFFSFTSNVDAHAFDKFHAHEVHECHGNIELWQCTDTENCASGIWRAPLSHRFVVDPETMLAPAAIDKETLANEESKQASTNEQDGTDAPRIGHTAGNQRVNPLVYLPPAIDQKGWSLKEGENWPCCGHCDCLARPAILMFGDFQWKDDYSQYQRWDWWRDAVLEVCESRRDAELLRVCILEIGCGLNVPTGRHTSEYMVDSVQEIGGKATLIRINPDFPLSTDAAVSQNLIPIMSTGLRALERIDEMVQKTSS